MSFDPISLGLALAASAAGTYMQNSALKSADQNRAATIRAQADRNEQFRKKSSAEFDRSLSEYQGGKPQDDMAALKAQLADALSQQQVGGGTGPTPGGTSQAMTEALAKARADGSARVEQRGNAMADMRSLGDLLFGNNIDLNRANQRIGANSFNVRSSNTALPYELDAIGKGSSMLGDLLVAGGTALGNSGFKFGSLVPKGPTNIIPAGY